MTDNSPTPLDNVIPLAHREPRSFTEAQVGDICQDVLGLTRVRPDADLLTIGVNSLQAGRIISRINRLFGVRLPLGSFFTSPTIEQLAALIRSRPEGRTTQRVVHVAGPAGASRFFCVHAQSGEVFFLRTLRLMPPQLEVWGIRSAGIDDGEPPLRSIGEMAARYVGDIRRIQPHGPYLLGGYCMGGLIAVEMARRLQSLGEEVAMLALLDTELHANGKTEAEEPPPGKLDLESVMREIADSEMALPAREGAAEDGAADDGLAPPATPDPGAGTAEAYWAAAVAKLKNRARLPSDVDAEFYKRRLVVAALNTIAAASHTVVPADIAIDFYASTDLADQRQDLADAWESVARHGVEMIDVETGHFDFFYSLELRRQLEARVARATGSRRSLQDEGMR